MELKYALIIAFGFLTGGILFSYHLPKIIKGVDVTRESWDHNPGAANAMKLAGVPVGLVCLAADILKGFLPVRVGMNALNVESAWFAMVLTAPAWGHASALFYRKPGGKAIAVSFGVLLALVPVSEAFWVLAGAYILFSTALPIRAHERKTVCSFAVLLLWSILFEGKRRLSVALGSAAISMIVMWKNRNSREEICPET